MANEICPLCGWTIISKRIHKNYCFMKSPQEADPERSEKLSHTKAVLPECIPYEVDCENHTEILLVKALSIAWEALGRINGMHGENECGMCGSYDTARKAMRRIEELGK